MTAKVYAFPSGEELPAVKKSDTERIQKKIRVDQTKKAADVLADELIIRLIGELQQEGMDIGKLDPVKSSKTFLDVGIFLECFRALIYKELNLTHPFHNVTNALMYVEHNKGKKYSVINYRGKKIINRETNKVEVEFDDSLLNDTD